jgi:hypothetical protein
LIVKFKLTGGAEIDLFTADEARTVVRDELAGWHREITRGVKWRTFSGQTVNNGAAWTMADPNAEALGPREGFVWAVTRLTVSGGGVVAGTDTYTLAVNELTPSRLVETGLTRGIRFDIGALVLNGGDRLVFTGASTGALGAPIVVSGAAAELPAQLSWRFL